MCEYESIKCPHCGMMFPFRMTPIITKKFVERIEKEKKK